MLEKNNFKRLVITIVLLVLAAGLFIPYIGKASIDNPVTGGNTDIIRIRKIADSHQFIDPGIYQIQVPGSADHIYFYKGRDGQVFMDVVKINEQDKRQKWKIQ